MGQIIGDDKEWYLCSNCKYQFSRRKDFPLYGVCPNCSKNTLQKKFAKSKDWVQDL